MGEAVAGGVAADALDEAAMAQASEGFIYGGRGVAMGGGMEGGAVGGAVEGEVGEDEIGGAGGQFIGGRAVGGDGEELDGFGEGGGGLGDELGGECARGLAAHSGGFEAGDGGGGGGVDVNEGIGEGFEVGDAAECAVFVEVVDEEEGDAGFVGDVAQGVDGVEDAVEVVFQAVGGEAVEGVNDDEAGAAFKDEAVEEVALARGGETPVVEGGGVEV